MSSSVKHPRRCGPQCHISVAIDARLADVAKWMNCYEIRDTGHLVRGMVGLQLIDDGEYGESEMGI